MKKYIIISLVILLINIFSGFVHGDSLCVTGPPFGDTEYLQNAKYYYMDWFNETCHYHPNSTTTLFISTLENNNIKSLYIFAHNGRYLYNDNKTKFERFKITDLKNIMNDKIPIQIVMVFGCGNGIDGTTYEIANALIKNDTHYCFAVYFAEPLWDEAGWDFQRVFFDSIANGNTTGFSFLKAKDYIYNQTEYNVTQNGKKLPWIGKPAFLGNESLTINELKKDLEEKYMKFDTDCDNGIDIDDLIVFALSYGYNDKCHLYRDSCDHNDDGNVNIYDLILFAQQYGESYPSFYGYENEPLYNKWIK